MCFDFMNNSVLNIFNYKKSWARYYQKYISVCITVPVICVRFYYNLHFFSTVVWKMLKSQILKKCVQWEPNFSMRTDRQTCWTQQSLFAILRKRYKNSERGMTRSVAGHDRGHIMGGGYVVDVGGGWDCWDQVRGCRNVVQCHHGVFVRQ